MSINAEMSELSKESGRYVTSGEYCRIKGWGPGLRLVGDEGYGPSVIEITAVGEEGILAKMLTHKGKPPRTGIRESAWTLECRDWKPVEVAL